jgi:alkanesulfonate monooxygenase SsuD/methylene tetrahydromethanopterin reductase-like flavin-dependent oxidoreductase (luciferase family)
MDDIWNIYEEQAVNQMLTYSFIGGPGKLRNDVLSFVEKTGVNEVMATSHIFDHRARLKSYEIFSNVFR